MKKVVLYGSETCPDCVVAKEVLDKEGIRYGYVDILAGLAHLKKFLAIRNAHPEIYSTPEFIASGAIGIPTIVVEDADLYLSADNMNFADIRG